MTPLLSVATATLAFAAALLALRLMVPL